MKKKISFINKPNCIYKLKKIYQIQIYKKQIDSTFWTNQWFVPLLLTWTPSLSECFLYWRPTRKVLQLEECIMHYFKVDLNILVICKTIKIEIAVRINQNTHKGDNKNILRGDKKKRTQNSYQWKEKEIGGRWGCHQRRNMAAPSTTLKERLEKERREKYARDFCQ